MSEVGGNAMREERTGDAGLIEEGSVVRGREVRVPEALIRRAGSDDEGCYEFGILGAGCAGLSLCHYLLELGVESPILILDHRQGFADDRTWCFWDVEPTPFSHLAVHSWSSWCLKTPGSAALQTTHRYPYRCITGADFYEYALQRLAVHENVTLRLGEAVEGYKEHDGETYVKTSTKSYAARYGFDGRGFAPGSAAFEEVRRRSCWLPQKFLGLRVRAEKSVFDPEVCTLMDFSVDQGRGLRFAYVLPFGSREALVENVYLSDAEISPDEHRAELAGYLRDSYGLSPDDYAVEGEESGVIPMTDYRFPRRLGERAYSIGMLGGESRPSTGYTFLRIQRYCRRLAESVIAGAAVPERVEPRRYDVLDGIFLRFMRRYPERCPSVYHRMFSRVPPDTLVRFLTERSSLADESRLVLAMPKIPFLGLAFRRIFEAGLCSGE
ncbi:MAG: lycopene cyclase family protein [Actinomycetota bacterium]|nr:lycopene cyclase family protein [Actinomycetota bacterium]